jgi:hypothetical protein
MTTKTTVTALSLITLSFAYGCASHNTRTATTPVGRSTTTGAVICPQGYVTSVDGEKCVPPEEPPADYEFQPPP